ncbi:hypothetical protein CR513_57807, partial [Mucuna pruriens]
MEHRFLKRNIKSILNRRPTTNQSLWIIDLGASNHIYVTLDANSFVIQEYGTGHESLGLYYLEMSPSMSCDVVSSPKLLHEQFGHPKFSKLK